MKKHLLIPLAVPVLGCSSPSKTSSPAKPIITHTEPSPSVASPGFDNHGGMWMPEQLIDHKQTLNELGLKIDISTLANPLEAPLAAIVSLGGCSASFVSDQGLMVTNHHCVQGALQYHSTPETNYVESGFLAKTMAEEKWNGPSAKVWVTRSITDVSSQILNGLDSITDPKDRYDEIENREKRIVATCENDRPNTRCQVASYFQGAEFKLIESMEIRDIRMVYAPDQGIGVFGGDEDNWMWPRHTGDFSFYRAYVGPDGTPADYSKDNIPFTPQHVLTIASSPLRENDLVMVAGYPGRTFLHRTAAEVKDDIEWNYPRKIENFVESLATIRSITDNDPTAKIKATSMTAGRMNYLKNARGMLESLNEGGLYATKTELEAEIRTWIAADRDRDKRYGHLFDELDALQKEKNATRERDRTLQGLDSKLLGVALTIVRMAEERPKADEDRDPDYQERQWNRIEARFSALDRSYHKKLDMALLGLSIEKATRSRSNADWLRKLFGKADMQRSKIDKRLKQMYKGSKLDDVNVRIRWLKTATRRKLVKSKDPFLQLALKLVPMLREIEDKQKSFSGKMALLMPQYLSALQGYSKGPIAPDANGTLRVTYGTVHGYRPSPDRPMYKPFTLMSEVIAKHKDAFPFDVPDRQLAAVEDKKFGNYVSEELGEIPVNFLSDVHTTGGNSGSPTLNANGELVGLLFDGTFEAMASDYVFVPETTRSIHCDARYILWIMDAVDGADRLLEEMGVTPSL